MYPTTTISTHRASSSPPTSPTHSGSCLFINLSVPVAVYLLMYRERLFPCSNQSPRLLDKEKNQQDHNIQGHGGLLGCCNYDDMKDCPASYFLYILGGAVLFITDGIIGFYTGFIYTYAVSSPLSATQDGWLSDQCVLGICHRGQTGIYISVIQIHTTTTNQCQPVGVIVVQCLLLILYSSHVSIFMGMCVLGLFISSVFPCMVALTEDMVNYKGCVNTVLVTSAGTGEMVLQLLTGQLIHSKGSHSFLLVSMISSCIGFTVFLGLLYIQHLQRSSQAAKGVSKEIAMTEKPSSE